MKRIFKATAVSSANIAFIKYWGCRDFALNLPYNDSISMNLSDCLTRTTVEFSSDYQGDQVFIDNKKVTGTKEKRVVGILNLIRKKADLALKAKVYSKNNFPQGTGIASSSSAFSALALAGTAAAGLSLSKKELSILARRGCGSACRSVISGFAQWKAGKKNEDSYAVQLAPENFWKLRDLVLVVSDKEKKIGSLEGHKLALTSPYFKARVKRLPKKIKKFKKAFLAKNFLVFGQIIEEEAVDLHAVAMTSFPPVFYWNEMTVKIINAVHEWRSEGLPVYFTIDAGPNVHLIFEEKNETAVLKKVKDLKGVLYCIKNKPAKGTSLSEKHLF